MGTAPGEIYLEPGSHLLMLQKPGYNHEERVIEITLDQEEMVLTETLSKVSKPIFTRWWFLTGTTAALASGAYFLLGQGSEAQPLPEPPDFPQ